MRQVTFSSAIVATVLFAGCVDLTAVNDFAKESSVLSSDKDMLDDTDAQTRARAYDAGGFMDPKSKEFTDRLAVTNRALVALNGYMTVLAQLSANGVATVNPEVSTIDTALKSLNVSNAELQPIANATGALANLLLDVTVRNDIKKLVLGAAPHVDLITTYLADQAQITSNTYTQAIAVNNKRWGDLARQTAEDKKFCETSSICGVVYELGTHSRDVDNASLSAKAASAGAAAAAFKKIGKDNAALVRDADHLNAKDLIATLRTDEPDLLAAIRNIRAL